MENTGREEMIVNSVKGNIEDMDFKNHAVDYVDVHWYDSGKRIQKLNTNKGVQIGIRLKSDEMNRGLLQGDVLEIIGREAIVVNILEERCITVKANDLKTVAKVCYEIGNRHSPLFYSEDYSQLILPYDKPILEMLRKLEVDTDVKMMKIHRDKAISSVNTIHSHEDEHTHSHSHNHYHSHEHES